MPIISNVIREPCDTLQMTFRRGILIGNYRDAVTLRIRQIFQVTSSLVVTRNSLFRPTIHFKVERNFLSTKFHANYTLSLLHENFEISFRPVILEYKYKYELFKDCNRQC